MTVDTVKSLALKAGGMRSQLRNELKEERERLASLDKRMKTIEVAQAFIQKVAKETQEHLRFEVEDIVNLALETCFPGEYEFRLDFNIARGKTEARLVFLSQKTGREVDPMNASGGGVVDLTAFALRIACYALERGIDNVIILDEPFRFISRDLQSRAGEILRMLSTKLGVQVIMVTHIAEMIDVADRVFEVRKNADGRSVVSVR